MKPYTDTVGKLTIGIGHNLTDKGISSGVVEELFHDDVADAMTVLATIWPEWSQLDDVRQNVMVDLAFNLGSRLASFHNFLAAMMRHDWSSAASALQDSLWFKQVGSRGVRLTQMIRTGQWPSELA